MKINEVIVKEWTGPGKEFAPPTPKDFLPKKKQKLVMAQGEDEGLTSGADIVLSKNGEQAVIDLKLSDQEVELLKAVALGWADPSDLGDLEQDIFDYWLEANPEDFNPNLHGGGADPSDTIMDELESWFEDAVKEWSKGDTAAAAKDSKKVQRTGTHANRKWAVGEEREDDAPVAPRKNVGTGVNSSPMVTSKKKKLDPRIKMDYTDDEENVNTLMGSEEGAPTIDDLARMLKLAGVKSEAAGKAKPVNRNSGSWWSGDIDGSEFAINKAASQVDDFSAGGTVDPKPSFGDVEGISKPTPNVDTFSSKFHKSPDWKNIDVTPKKRKNTDPDR